MKPTPPRSALEARGLSAKKSFGQNFLTDPGVTQRIAELATTPPGGTVLELGAGLGALTLRLAERASRVVAVERDRDLVPILAEELATHGMTDRVELLEADAKSVEVERCLVGPSPRVLAGNLPYQLTGPLVRRAIAARERVDRVVFLVQLEVADRLTAKPGTEAWGGLSVFTQAAFDVKKAFVVRRGCFFPQPRVDSAVVVLEPGPQARAEETPMFRDLVSRAFTKRRKTLRNAWRNVAGLSDTAVAAAAAEAGIDLGQRGEVLEIEAFKRMADALGDGQ